jgi:hypothetical protein
MPELQAQRRLVKSPPELWAEVSDAASLARHLGEVGEITITRAEPESTVAWEGELASGTVQLEPAGWGTRVTLTAQPSGGAAEPAPEAAAPAAEPAAAAPEPAPAAEPQAPARPSLLRRLFGRRTPEPVANVHAPVPPAPVAEPPAPEPEQVADPDPADDGLHAALTAALDSLGAAHHRPFSRG